MEKLRLVAWLALAGAAFSSLAYLMFLGTGKYPRHYDRTAREDAIFLACKLMWCGFVLWALLIHR